jgi:hypothetical protein
VCGAPNHKVGDIVPLALPGTKFSEGIVIVKSKIRGEESNGMLCSARELQFSDEHSGIMILPPDTKLASSVYPIFSETESISVSKSTTSQSRIVPTCGDISVSRANSARYSTAQLKIRSNASSHHHSKAPKSCQYRSSVRTRLPVTAVSS